MRGAWRRQREKGASAVEFALAMPIFFIIVFGIFEFGLAFWYQQELTSAVREGARKGVTTTARSNGWTADQIMQYTKDYMTNVGMTSGSRTVTCTNNCPCTASGNTLTITATYPSDFTVISNLTKLWWGTTGIATTRTLTATVSMQCE